MERPPRSIIDLASGFYQHSHEEYATAEEWKIGTANWMLPPGPRREEAKAYLDRMIAGPYTDAELMQFWTDAGSDYTSRQARELLKSIRAALDAPYVKPKL